MRHDISSRCMSTDVLIYLIYLHSFNIKDNSLLPILDAFIMKSHKEPLKNVLFANTESSVPPAGHLVVTG